MNVGLRETLCKHISLWEQIKMKNIAWSGDFGPNWPRQRCGEKTREGRARISPANFCNDVKHSNA